MTRAIFKALAVIAETGVFIYLGEALFSYPILHNTVWRLVIIALVACGLGRLHVIAGVRLTNLWREHTISTLLPGKFRRLGSNLRRLGRQTSPSRRSDVPSSGSRPLSNGVALVLWWSGLRGGVAFALASSSYSYGQFDQHCGGLAHTRHLSCPEGKAMTDGLAILQVPSLPMHPWEPTCTHSPHMYPQVK